MKLKQSTAQWRKLEYLIPGCIIIIGEFFLLIFRFNHESVWCDEAYTWAMTNHSFNDIIIYTIIFENHPPLFYLLVKTFRLLGGNSILTIRLFSVLGALTLAALGLGPVRRACGNKTALLYSCLVILTPSILSMAQDGRMYTWSAFFVTGTVLYAYLAATGGKRSDWINLGVFTLGAAYLHYYALLAVAIANLILMCWLIIKNRRRLLPYLITMGVVLICFLPWIPSFIKQITTKYNQGFWIPPVSFDTIWKTLSFPFGDKFCSAPELFIFRPYAFGLACALILWGLWQTKAQKAREHSLNLWCIAVYILTFLTGIVLSYLIRPIWVERYIATVLGLFILSLAIGLSFIRNKRTFIVTCILIIGFTLPGIYQIYQQRFNGPMREVVAYLKPKLPVDAIFVHFDWTTRNTFYYYFPNHKHYVYMPKFNKNNKDPVFFAQSPAGPDLDSFLKGKNNIWFVTKLGFSGEDTATAVIALKKLTLVSPPQIFMLPYSEFGVSLSQVIPYQP